MAFRKTITNDRNLQQVQDAIESAFRVLLRSPLASSVMVKAVSLTAGQDNLIPHGLGRPPALYLIAGQDTDARIWSPVTSQLQNLNANDRWINLQTSSNCVVNLIFSKGL